PQQEGQEVIMTGSVRFDNGSLVPEEFVTLVLPDTTIAVALDSVTGAFTHTGVFAAGNHDITATITPENGFTFDDTVTLVINANAAPPGDNGDGDGDDDDPDGGGNFACPVDECYENNECVPCTETNNNNQNNNGNNNNLDNTFLGDGDSGLVYYCGDGDCDYTENCNKCAEDCGECKECDKDSECGKGKKCNNGKCIGQQGWAGKATGFLNFSRINTSLFWWAVLILLSIMFVLAYLRKRGTPGFSKEDTMGLDDYIDNINRKQ
ncbi:MAG: hypothetical protein KKE20_06560, partial [Nanoarchaeota archaeon]|nr:hypothetical protein [Nanoarchaeota archaeon]